MTNVSSGVEPTKPTSPLWYLAALSLTMVGFMVGVGVSGTAWNLVRASPISSANSALQAEGASIAVFTDVVQADRRITCAMTNVATDAAPETIPPATIPLTVEDDGTTWNLVAFQREGRDGVIVKCTPRDRSVDNAQYAFATVTGFTQRLWTGTAIVGACFVASLAIAGVVFVRRRRELRARRGE